MYTEESTVSQLIPLQSSILIRLELALGNSFECETIMSSSDALQKMIVLKSSDGELFEVEVAVALESQTIKLMIEDNCSYTVIPLFNVTSEILAMVILYCKRHVEVSSKATADGGIIAADKVELKKFDADFVNVDLGTLFDLFLAANYLNIESLHGLTCQAVADIIEGMTVENVRQLFNITNDFTPDEEEELSRENAWAFD